MNLLNHRSTHLSPSSSLGARRFQRAALLVLVASISVLFVLVVRGFLLSVFLAAIAAGLLYPVFIWLRTRLGGRAALASLSTILLVLLVIVIPMAGFLALVVSESVQLSQSVVAWLQSGPDRLEQLRQIAVRVPLVGRMVPERAEIAAQLTELSARLGPLLAGKIAAVGRSTLSFSLQLFVWGYALFYFLVDGPALLRRLRFYLPLRDEEERQLLDRFVSVTRATIKGSLFIGIVQGALGGLAFWVTGVPGPAFWGTVMIVFSIIPAVGAALVWIPAVVYLAVTGAEGAALGLLAWCTLVVSTVDNFLRPRLVGRDAKMSDLMILISTLGGITLFGALGFIIGPIIAALFVTVWHIYGQAFGEWLPAVSSPPDARAADAASSGHTPTGMV